MDRPAVSPVIPAASLIVYRPAAAGGPPELLLVRRATRLAFAGGAQVFPGGRVDPDDHLLAAGSADPADGAARVAAIRETLEEAGVAIGLAPTPDIAVVAALRTALKAGTALSALLPRYGLRLVPAALIPFSRWQPPPGVASRTFDTRFYLAEVPAGTPAQADGVESVAAEWRTAAALLADDAAGGAALMFPTLCHLHRCAGHGDFAAARADAAAHPPTLIVSSSELVDGTTWLTIPADLGYPLTRQRLDATHRS